MAAEGGRAGLVFLMVLWLIANIFAEIEQSWTETLQVWWSGVWNRWDLFT